MPLLSNKHKQILIAEDDNVLRKVLEELLLKAGYNVLTARNGQQAFYFLETTGADIVLSDNNMPHLTGLEFLEKVRNSENLSHTPFILMSANEQGNGKIQPDAFLKKPFSAATLLLLLDTHLQP